MSVEEALFRAVLAEPDADMPRLIYADWLEDQGEPRAEFIRVQCALEGLTQPRDALLREELKARARMLLAEHRRRWNGEVHRRLHGGPLANQVRGRRGLLNGWAYRRGFVEAVSMPLEAFLQHAETLFQKVGPLRYLRFPLREQPAGVNLGKRSMKETHKLIRQLAESSWLARVTTLDLHNHFLDEEDARILAASPYLARITTLDLSENDLTAESEDVLRSSPHLGALKVLHLVHNRHNRARGSMRNRRRRGPFPWLENDEPPSGWSPHRGYGNPDA